MRTFKQIVHGTRRGGSTRPSSIRHLQESAADLITIREVLTTTPTQPQPIRTGLTCIFALNRLCAETRPGTSGAAAYAPRYQPPGESDNENDD